MDAPPTISGTALPGLQTPPPAGPLDPGQLQALIHLYRAEVGRMVSYRQRLDTTTNWSITSVAAVTTFSLATATIPHEAFLFLMVINVFFLVLEARRFKAYEAARYRVLLLEHYFYPEVLTGPEEGSDWRRVLVQALRTPYYPRVGNLGALGWRLRRNYVWIYLAILLTWIAKLEIGGGPATSLLEAAAVGSIPGTSVWALVAIGYLAMVSIAVLARRSYPMGSETAQTLLSQEPD
jgi:uncharacterized membrane protein